MVLDSSGLALTNYHVVENSVQIQATVASTGETYDATWSASTRTPTSR